MNATTTNPAAPLSQTLLATARTVQAVLQGMSLTEALAQIPSAQRPAVQALAFHALRHLGTARAVRAQLVPRTPADGLLDALLLTSLTLLPGIDDAKAPRYAAHTVVDQAVRACEARALVRFKGLVNACLRRFLRETDSLLGEAQQSPEGRWNFPTWWVRQLRTDHPDAWQDILNAAQQPAPLTLRINQRRATRPQVQEALAEAGIGAAPVGETGLVLARAKPVTSLPGFAEGWWSVQDAGAQMAATLLDPAPGARVLDACAAPGGKAAHLLERTDNLDLLAIDSDATRLARIDENFARLGLSATVRQGDAAQPADWWDGRPFDAILADVPCTGSGVVRRHPDIRWLRRAADLNRTAALQHDILEALWPLLAPGGTLLYVTCSVFRSEGEQQVQRWLRGHPEARRLPAPGQLLPGGPHAALAQQHDGYFYARFQKP